MEVLLVVVAVLITTRPQYVETTTSTVLASLGHTRAFLELNVAPWMVLSVTSVQRRLANTVIRPGKNLQYTDTQPIWRAVAESATYFGIVSSTSSSHIVDLCTSLVITELECRIPTILNMSTAPAEEWRETPYTWGKVAAPTNKQNGF